MLGNEGGLARPPMMGMIRDVLDGDTLRNLGTGFAHLAVIMRVGPAALAVPDPEVSPASGHRDDPVIRG